ncbi:hypothetical protein GALMADRAFT_147438 [Galerina marginata CBS 339.88]|uniref:Uncharacterized protein n=1 Tax=Galerina marginata (strain CBS 339.88) TaxID=685588 RepID=A0A067SJT1_GALM3|nr:hypothetical protein GALMADRAFT_147438 [Galerina marginata CBS 339.88]
MLTFFTVGRTWTYLLQGATSDALPPLFCTKIKNLRIGCLFGYREPVYTGARMKLHGFSEGKRSAFYCIPSAPDLPNQQSIPSRTRSSASTLATTWHKLHVWDAVSGINDIGYPTYPDRQPARLAIGIRTQIRIYQLSFYHAERGVILRGGPKLWRVSGYSGQRRRDRLEELCRDIVGPGTKRHMRPASTILHLLFNVGQVRSCKFEHEVSSSSCPRHQDSSRLRHPTHTQRSQIPQKLRRGFQRIRPLPQDRQLQRVFYDI